MKSFKPKQGRDEPPADGGGRNQETDFHGEKRSNDTHASTTDPEARLCRKGPGKEARLCLMGHALMENRNGLLVDACVTQADGHAERIAALRMIEPRAVDERNAACRPEHKRTHVGGRRPHYAPRRLRRQPAHPQTDRGSLRLDEDDRRAREDQVPRTRPRQLGLHLRGWRLQSRAVAQAHRRAAISAPANCKLIGRWRIVQADIWERDHLDLCGPAMMTITDHGRGEIAFGALQAGLDIEYSRSSVGFTWEGFDEMDEVSGDGSAELLDDGSIEIEFAYHNGDEAVLKAKRENSSTTC